MECPVCKQQVSSFKTNSHIIPRWAMKEIKDNGKFVQIIDNELKEKAQTDPKADIVCNICENRFASDDAYGAEFYRDKKHIITTEIISSKGINIPLEKYDNKHRENLLRFLVSLLLRSDLYRKSKRQGSELGPKFEDLASEYVSEELNSKNWPVTSYKYADHHTLHSLPYKTRFDGIICQEIMFFGYRHWIYTGKQKPTFEIDPFLYQPKLVIPIIKGTNNAYSSDLKNKITSLKY